MIVLFPGTVTVYIPYRLLRPTAVPDPAIWSASQWGAMVVIAAGTAILLWSVWEFGRTGRGTLAPFDETETLVINGLYRYVRNPMYVGVIAILLGESWFFESVSLLKYAVLCLVIANILVIGYEEKRLRYKYGDAYRQYCSKVGRWIPGYPYK